MRTKGPLRPREPRVLEAQSSVTKHAYRNQKKPARLAGKHSHLHQFNTNKKQLTTINTCKDSVFAASCAGNGCAVAANCARYCATAVLGYREEHFGSFAF